MRNYLLIVLLIIAALITTSCGEGESDPVAEEQRESDVLDEVDPVAGDELDVAPDPIDESGEEVTEDVSEELMDMELAEVAIITTQLPEPWPADFPIPDCFEVISNEQDGNGDWVLVAAVPEGTDRPGVWDLGYYFRDEIEGWGVAEENNWDCMLSAFDFKVPLTQENSHIFVRGWFDTGNIMTVELFWTKDVE